MAALADFDAYKTLIDRAGDFSVGLSLQNAAEVSRLVDMYNFTFPLPGAPTTAVALSRANETAINAAWRGAPNAAMRIISARSPGIGTSGLIGQGAYLLVDRLSHQGGLSGTTTTAQTTNLPTAALTRYTDGVGVMAALTIYTDVGTTAVSPTISYTNQAGTSGQTSGSFQFGGTGWDDAGRTFIVPLAVGDTGVRAVASVTLGVSTGTAGAFGVTLFKPLAMIIVDGAGFQQQQIDFVSSGGIIGLGSEVHADAHLSLMQVSTVASNLAFVDLAFALV